MNKLSKIFLAIIIVLIIIIIVSINRCLYFKNAYENVATGMMELTEKANKIEADYNRSMDNVKIEIEQASSTGATIIITDNNEIPYIWKENYTIEKKENGKWIELETLADANFSDVVYKVDNNNQIKEVIDWRNLYGTLSKGTYRIVKYVYTADSDLYFQSDEFTIE